MKHFVYLILISICFGLNAKDKLNILLFTADDLHSESLGTYGGRPSDLTPQLDKFASEGIQFQRAHVNVAICYPCRTVIGTGLYSHNSGGLGFMPTRPEIPNVIDLMKDGGYMTGILGKQDHSTPKPASKWDYAFDQKDLGDGRSPTLYKQRSVDFFNKCKETNKNFYFMVNSHDPHRPYCYPDNLRKGAEMPSKVYTAKDVSVPRFLPDLPGVRDEYAAYLNSTRRLDDTFGAVMEALDDSGLADNTLVIFMSDNGIAMPFAKCNTWFYSSRTPLLVRWPKVIEANRKDGKHFVSTIDLLPTFLELTGVKGPAKLDGRSLVPLFKLEEQDGRDFVYTQIDKKAGSAAVPMRAVQNKKFGYIYNAFKQEERYRNNNEGLTMKAMEKAAKKDEQIAARIDLFRHRPSEEFYDIENDPNCLVNLIDNPEYKVEIEKFKKKLTMNMKTTNDPMLKAFENRNDRAIVDQVIASTYGNATKVKKSKKRKK
ncbi:sulfatase [Lentisphaera marina]|uniref:sulfatase family protein n=1 Tax=Lentisphaera marina TaxID=1111041 RepID=UPI002366BB77|nr:sulfatase [Lentisphaera marina]MDD7987321.1 sulfatase [Lentisphaera marina]